MAHFQLSKAEAEEWERKQREVSPEEAREEAAIRSAKYWREYHERMAKARKESPNKRYLTVGELTDALKAYPADTLILIEDPDTSWDAPIFVKQEEDGTVLLWSEYGEMDSSGKFYRNKEPHG